MSEEVSVLVNRARAKLVNARAAVREAALEEAIDAVQTSRRQHNDALDNLARLLATSSNRASEGLTSVREAKTLLDVAAVVLDPPIDPPPPSSLAWPPMGKSGLTWNSGCWAQPGARAIVNNLVPWRGGHDMDVITNSAHERGSWAEIAGCRTQADFDREWAIPPGGMTTANIQSAGTFAEGWHDQCFVDPYMKQRWFHLGWHLFNPIGLSNAHSSRPVMWYWLGRNRDPEGWTGPTHKHAPFHFHVGRKLAAKQRIHGREHGITVDLAMEFPFPGRQDYPGGTYTHPETAEVAEACLAHRVAWAIAAQAIKAGWVHEGGDPSKLKLCWRPLQYKLIRRKGGAWAEYEDLCPLVVKGTVIEAVTHRGLTILPEGPIGKSVDLLAMSFHDQAHPQVKGSSATEPGNNWSLLMNGSLGTEPPLVTATGIRPAWGFAELRALAIEHQVSVCLPEWGPKRQYKAVAAAPNNKSSSEKGGHVYPGAGSPYPGDVLRFFRWMLSEISDVLAYETAFLLGDGDTFAEPWWQPNRTKVQPGQNPKKIYAELWS